MGKSFLEILVRKPNSNTNTQKYGINSKFSAKSSLARVF